MRFIYSMIFILSFLLQAQAGFAQPLQNVETDTVNFTDAGGNKQGIWRENFNTGLLKRETIYKDGQKNGLDLLFFQWPNCLKEESEYVNDTLIRKISYHRNCNIKMVESYSKGQRDGYTRVYNSNGILETEGLYRKGKLQGTLKKFDKEGIAKQDNDLIQPIVSLEGYLNNEELEIDDSTVLKALSKIPLTKNSVIVTDVTGSMHNNVGQLLLWYNLQMHKTPVKRFVFFNDGDNMPDLKKKIGKTGG
ncbi:MAG: toxin-antitoxin system YwqK family antitoxin, partial [Bacteroidia bacterium]